ncbi:MAG: beta-glucosidase BglX [Vicinamibacteria bacterium]|nr:beta-glucosidase BglX [Vicinamibacteria bacterium]
MKIRNPLYRRLFLLLAAAGCASPLFGGALTNPETEKRIDSLLERMTLQEKVGQLVQYSDVFNTGPAADNDRNRRRNERIRTGQIGSLLNVTGAQATRETQKLAVEGSRLRIPLIFGLDVIHGYKTSFPIPLAEAASFDMETVALSARIAAIEAAAAGIHWTFAPMVDIARDARWGRIMEGAGEDPYLGAQVAAARVRGFQGNDLAAVDTIAACAKHYAAYGFAEGGRDYNTVDVSEHTLRNVVLPPFKAASEAGVVTFMNAFNEIGGVPATASAFLQRTILKGEWGFEGFIVSDWNSIGELVQHGVAKDGREAARLAITAGSDMDMESSVYDRHLVELAESGAVDKRLIDDAVRRVLRVKFRLGLFDDPYRYSNDERERRALADPAHSEAAREVARQSIVLLRNEGGLLPLGKTGGILAVIGPLADDTDTPKGNWRGRAATDPAVSLLEGIRAAVGSDVKVRHAAGARLDVIDRGFFRQVRFDEEDRSGFPAAIEAARDADAVILAIGETAFQTGEAQSQVEISLQPIHVDLLREVHAVNRNVVLVLMNGRPLVIGEIAETVPAIVEAWHLGAQAGHAIADVLFGDYNPSGKLPVSFPRHVGQEPLYYNAKNTGRPGPQESFYSYYTDCPNTPLYPFGFGLSYTTFEYSDLKLSRQEIGPDDELRVTVTVANTGQRTGVEVAQLYIRDLVGSVTRPVKELKGFQKVELAPGEAKAIAFTVTSKDLAFYTAAGRWEAEPGAFDVYVGGNSDDLQKAEFTLR